MAAALVPVAGLAAIISFTHAETSSRTDSGSSTPLQTAFLTAIQRRDPAGFARFLRSGSPAARYPVRFCRARAGNTPHRIDRPRSVDTPAPHGPESVQDPDRSQFGEEVL
jgi:hypothetical protein